MTTEHKPQKEQPDLVSGWVSVIVEIDGERHDLGHSLFMFERGEDPSDFAQPMLKAWDETRNKADRTLRLYGVEGIARRLTEGRAG